MAIPFSFSGNSDLKIDPVLLPLGVEVNAVGGPRFNTARAKSASGKEKRFSYMTAPRREYTAAFNPDLIAEVLDIYTAGLGPRFGFMARDWSDYQFTDSVLVEVESTDGNAYQISKTYTRTNYFDSSIVRSFTRDLLLPDPATVVVSVNGTPDNTFTLTDDGVIYSASSFATGDIITATGEFFVPVIFDEDSLKLLLHAPDVGSIQQVNLIEVLPGDLP